MRPEIRNFAALDKQKKEKKALVAEQPCYRIVMKIRKERGPSVTYGHTLRQSKKLLTFRGTEMIFERLWESAKRNELILVDGGLCHWHLRTDGQITVREMIVLPDRQRQGIGSRMLYMLRQQTQASNIYLKCPSDLAANGWYEHKGFKFAGEETSATGRRMTCWRLDL